MIKSPLRYPGGKSKAMKFLRDLIPNHEELREPFFGGGSFSFHCLDRHPDNFFMASDLNYELYCFWDQLKKCPDKLCNEITHIRNTYKDGRELYKEIIQRRGGDDQFQKAVDFFILNRITFSGIVDAGGYSDESFHKRFTESSIARLKQAAEVALKIIFFCEDYSFLVDLCGKDVLLFLDPPYFSMKKSKLYGKDGILHTTFDHELLLKKLNKCNHRFMMTYDNCEYIKSLYKDYYMIDWELQYGMNSFCKKKASIGKEILISNFKVQQ